LTSLRVLLWSNTAIYWLKTFLQRTLLLQKCVNVSSRLAKAPKNYSFFVHIQKKIIHRSLFIGRLWVTDQYSWVNKTSVSVSANQGGLLADCLLLN